MVRIIAEAGVNHNGDIETAFRMIGIAAKAGADAVKFQGFTAKTLEPPGPRRDSLAKLQLSIRDMMVLKARCRKMRIGFLCTAFDPQWIDLLVRELGVDHIKIASGNLDNWPLLDAARESACEILLSTGAGTLDQVGHAVTRLGRRLVLLHCVSAYPAPPEDTNLAAMVNMGMTMACAYGLSDHSQGAVAPVAAVSLGASVIEKHFTLDRSAIGPDHAISMEPGEFARMVRNVRLAEKMRGDGDKRPMPSEQKTMAILEERRQWRESLSSA